jgi:hypothetical protein
MNNIICFLTYRPNDTYYNLCKEVLDQNFRVYICIDDNDYEIPNYDGKIPIIKIRREECEDAGFKNTVTCCKDIACSRDKALYYFCKIEKKYDYIWFLEEDVFIPSKTTIPYLDNKYKGDLITSSHEIIETNTYPWYFTRRTFDEYKEIFEPPYAKSMICAIRVSRKMMDAIEEYAAFYKTLHFCETIFNTLALKNNLTVVCPPELSTIVYRKDWKLNQINRHYLYHPIKDMNIQSEYRAYILNIQKSETLKNPP